MSGNGKPLSVLVAEDNEVNRMLLGSILKRLGHRHAVAADGLEAVAAVERGSFDVVLMDVQMPVVDGIEATRRIRAMAGDRGSLPIIALTANAMAGDRERYMAAGMTDYVSKPINIDDLSAALDRVAQSGSPRSARLMAHAGDSVSGNGG